MKKTLLMWIAFVGFGLSLSTLARAATVTLDWDPVTTNSDGSTITDLAGYTVYQATSSFNNGGVWISTTQATSLSTVAKYNVTGATTLSINSLAGGFTYFFRLTAYNQSNMQSGFNVDANGADVEVSSTTVTGNACDIDGSGQVDALDVQRDINAALSITGFPCVPPSIYDINKNGTCDALDVQRVINAALGGPCVTQ